MSEREQVSTEQKVATCRGCGRVLIGKPYYMGGNAYLPGPKRIAAKVNHYGGFVCSHRCDYRASLEQLRDMPRCGDALTPDCSAMATIRSNWPEHYR